MMNGRLKTWKAYLKQVFILSLTYCEFVILKTQHQKDYNLEESKEKF